MIEAAATCGGDLIAGINGGTLPRCDEEVQYPRQMEGVDGDEERRPRQGLDLQPAEKGRQDEVQLRPVSRLDQIGDEVSFHQENVCAEEAGEPHRVLGVRDDEDFNWPGITHLLLHFASCCAQYRESLWRDPRSCTEQACPVNLHRPPDRPESQKQASTEDGKRADAARTQQYDQAEAHEQDRC
jgi:hypothetical protein